MKLGIESNRQSLNADRRIRDAKEYFNTHGKAKTVKYISRKYGYSVTSSSMIINKHCVGLKK